MACSWSQPLQKTAAQHHLTATGQTLVADLPCAMRTFTMQTVCTGSATISIKLQGSVDGATWFDIATSTSATGDAVHGVDKPAVYLRADVTITGGTAPTVKVWVAATA